MALIENRYCTTKKEMKALVYGKQSGKLGVSAVYISNLDKKGRLVWATIRGVDVIDLIATAERSGLIIEGINRNVPANNNSKTKSAMKPLVGKTRETLERDKIKEQHRKLKLDNDTREGRLIEVGVVKDKVFELARSTRDAVMVVPSRISSKCVGMTAFDIEALMMDELSKALEKLLKGL